MGQAGLAQKKQQQLVINYLKRKKRIMNHKRHDFYYGEENMGKWGKDVLNNPFKPGVVVAIETKNGKRYFHTSTNMVLSMNLLSDRNALITYAILDQPLPAWRGRKQPYKNIGYELAVKKKDAKNFLTFERVEKNERNCIHKRIKVYRLGFPQPKGLVTSIKRDFFCFCDLIKYKEAVEQFTRPSRGSENLN
jgi:hypothetical protein